MEFITLSRYQDASQKLDTTYTFLNHGIENILLNWSNTRFTICCLIYFQVYFLPKLNTTAVTDLK